MADRLLPIIHGNKVTFEFEHPNATMLNVLGTFNHWDINSGVMEKGADGIWRKTVDVPLEGSYDYKFIADGEWILDPLNPDYGKDSRDRYNSRFQITTSASAVDHLRRIAIGLENNPPGGDFNERKKLFELADTMLQLPSAGYSRVLKNHLVERIESLTKKLTIKEDSFVAGVYCHGFAIQSAGKSFGLDIVTTRSVYGMYWDLPSKTIEGLADQFDCICASHLHPDHWDHLLMKYVIARGGKVLVPSAIAGRFPDGAVSVKPEETVDVFGWKVTFHSGQHVYDDQNKLILNYYEVLTPDCKRIVHTSDHDYTTGVKRGGDIDLLIAKAGGVNPVFEGRGKDAFINLLLHLKPNKFVAGHLNELGHPIKGGREPYKTGIEIVESARNRNGEILHWGETWKL